MSDPLDALHPPGPPMTRDDPAYVHWLKVLLMGLGGTVPLEAERAERAEQAERDEQAQPTNTPKKRAR
ncbi:hypothetical protein [Streptomyces sp. NPDC088258]|uniref:hypothetical protein n=1 Tax=Streptomyces sp. NPDC088258 TaxID=3365849 RepID=UPI0037F94A36